MFIALNKLLASQKMLSEGFEATYQSKENKTGTQLSSLRCCIDMKNPET